MTIDEIYQDIAQQMPPVIHLNGKTSTGKSTFGRKLHDELGYQVIELEAILLEIVKKNELDEQTTFRKVLYDAGELEAKTLYFDATDRIIAGVLSNNRPVVIKGAIANAETLQRILRPTPKLLFLYFHPTSTEVYIRNLTKRFMESNEESYGGLPLKFWQLIDDVEFKTFCKTQKLTENLNASIKQYALNSQRESLIRLKGFRQKFENIIVVEIS
jgi:adenylate kinase family enzyme